MGRLIDDGHQDSEQGERVEPARLGRRWAAGERPASVAEGRAGRTGGLRGEGCDGLGQDRLCAGIVRQTTALMDRLTVRLPPDLARRFDAAAAGHGGRSRLLRRLIEGAAQASLPAAETPSISPSSGKLTLRLGVDDLAVLEAAAAHAGLSRTQWAVALIRRRLHGRPQLTPSDSVVFIGVQRELRRIGVNVNQIARALNTAVLEGQVLALEVAQLDAFATEIRGHLSELQAAFRCNLDYWSDR